MKKIIIALICLAAGLALIFWAIKPLWASIGKVRDEIKSKNEEIIKIETLLAKQDELKKKYLDSKDDIDRIFLALPNGEDVSYDLSQIDTIAMKNGLLLSSIKFSGIEEESGGAGKNASQESSSLIAGFSTAGVEMNLSGSYEAFKGFLNDLESSLRTMKASSIRISPGKDSESGPGLFEFGLNINVYYQ